MSENIPNSIEESHIHGEKLIFDLVIKDKLAHVIVVKAQDNYHINLDGEDLGYFWKHEDGNITRYEQPKGAIKDVDAYFKPIEDHLKDIGKLS